MKRPRLITAFVLAMILPLLTPSLCCPFARRAEGRVVHVSDGDSITIRTGDGTRVEIRLANIDAPEIGCGRARKGERSICRSQRGQPFGKAARDALKAKVWRERIDVDVVDIDQYGRAVGVVYLHGRDINLEMVREGFAWAYRSHLHTPYASTYLDAEREARSQGLGIWKQRNPTPPWEFRKTARR